MLGGIEPPIITRVSYFDIQGYQPLWFTGLSAITAAHGQRLGALAGRRLRHGWLLWDLGADEWFSNGPVLLDFDGEQVEINHAKFGDLSVTWNTIDPAERATWSYGWDHEPYPYRVQLGWRRDARSELAALHGQQLLAAELLEYAGGGIADGMVAVSFGFPAGRVTVFNGLDENNLEFGGPNPDYLRHPLHA
jgi:hypothetical protein